MLEWMMSFTSEWVLLVIAASTSSIHKSGRLQNETESLATHEQTEGEIKSTHQYTHSNNVI